MSLKVGIFDPYLDTLGGGERYMMNMADCLLKSGEFEVEVFWNDQTIKEKLETRLGLDLKGLKVVKSIFTPDNNFLAKQKLMKSYDALFFMSDGSVPFLSAKKNFLCFMVPFTGVNGCSLANKIKLDRMAQVITISQFTKKFIDAEFGIESRIIYPPVSVDKFSPLKKENLILSVARFSQSDLHNKKQEVLVKAFKSLSADLPGWRLILAGGMKKGEGKDGVEKLKKMAQGFPVEILTNIDFKTLQDLYGRAKIFWHAAGFGEDENLHPERMEHFGIVVVEAMAAGCVPVVIGKGGIREIIDHDQTGFLWQTEEELKNQTLEIIKSKVKREKIICRAIKASQQFSQQVFCQQINELVNN